MEWLMTVCWVAGSLNLGIHLIIFTAFFWKKHRKVEASETLSPLSVIVAAHNEAAQLPHLLQALSDLEYDEKWEVLLVLDRCKDGSVEIAREAMAKFPQLRVLEVDQLPEGWTGKKYALQRGIEAATHEHLVFTDADCRPEKAWLRAMGEAFASGNALVLGGSPYVQEGGLLNLLIRMETLWTFVQYGGMALLGLPWMAVGRNLGYRRSFFEKVGGFGGIEQRLSGDDDLLVNRCPKGTRLAVLREKGSRVYSLPKRTWSAWFRQKTRHVSASTAYSLQSQLILGLIHGTHLLFYVSLIPLLIWMSGILPLGLFFLSRWIVLGALLNSAGAGWQKKGFSWAFPLFDLFVLAYNLVVVPVGLLRKPDW